MSKVSKSFSPKRLHESALAAFLLMVLTFPAVAQGELRAPELGSVPAVTAMTINEALQYAQGHQPELRAARERFLTVSAEARIASAQWLPSVGAAVELVGSSVNNSTGTGLAARYAELPRIGGTAIQTRPRWQPYATTLAAASLRQEVFDFGRIAAQEMADSALIAIERNRLQAAHLDISLLVVQGYYAVRAAHAVAVAAAQAEERAKVHRDFADVAVKAGLRPPIERTLAAADMAKYTVGRIRADGNIRIARSVFAAAVGYPSAELDAADSQEPSVPTPTLAQVEQRALANLPEVLQARDQRRAQHARTAAIDATLRPNLYASASVSARAGGAPANGGAVSEGRGFLPVVPNYDVGVVLSWPIYEPVVNAAVGASQQREWAFEAEFTAAQQRARTSAQQAYGRMRVAESALEALAQETDAARSNYEQAEARFRAGLGTSTELADAEALRLDAEVQQAVGDFELATARSQLKRVMGE